MSLDEIAVAYEPGKHVWALIALAFAGDLVGRFVYRRGRQPLARLKRSFETRSLSRQTL